MATILSAQLSTNQIGTFITLGLVIFLGGLTLLGLIYLITGGRGAFKLWQLKQRGQAAIGQVIDLKQSLWRSQANRGSRGWEKKAPVVRFYAPNGEWITFTSVNLERYTLGSQIQVRFLPENPNIAELPETTIFSGYNPTIFARLVYGIFAFPCAGFLLLQVLPKVADALSALN